MDAERYRYWSVEECCWVERFAAGAAVPAQREEQRENEPAREPVDA